MRKAIILCLLLVLTFTLAAGERKYKIKSGKFTTIMKGPYSSKSTTYFDDFGNKHYIESRTEMNFQGRKQTKKFATLHKGDSDYVIYHDSQSYMLVPEEEDDEETMDYDSDDVMMGDKVGTEKILGRNCDVYVKDNVKMWIWKGMPLKTEINENGQVLITEVISFEENPKIPAKIFNVPSGYSKQAAPTFGNMQMMEAASQSSAAKSKNVNTAKAANFQMKSLESMQKQKDQAEQSGKVMKTNEMKAKAVQAKSSNSKSIQNKTLQTKSLQSSTEKKTQKAVRKAVKTEEEKKKEEKKKTKETNKKVKAIKSLFN